VASEAEYLEIALAEWRDPEQLRLALDAALPPGLDVVACVPAAGGSLPDRIDAATWTIRLPGVSPSVAQTALTTLFAADTAPVDKMTKGGRKTVDVRAALVSGWLADPAEPRRESSTDAGSPDCAILGLVVRQQTPAVRPDDVMAAFRTVAGLEPPVPPEVTRLDQGRLSEDGSIVDPLDVQDGAKPVG
jgi:radical SAM-linked protein